MHARATCVRGESDSSREVDGEGDRGWLNVLYHFPLPLSFGHSQSGTHTAMVLTHFFKKNLIRARKEIQCISPWKRSYMKQTNVHWWVFFSNEEMKEKLNLHLLYLMIFAESLQRRRVLQISPEWCHKTYPCHWWQINSAACSASQRPFCSC